MENRNFTSIEDIGWRYPRNDEAQIKFTRNGKNRKIKGFFKVISFILVAAISGGVSGAYIIDKKYNGLVEKLALQSSLNLKAISNSQNKVIESVGKAVVSISNKAENFAEEFHQAFGSGVIFDNKGDIITNYHPIEKYDRIYVRLTSGRVYEAFVIGIEPNYDLAVIRINAQNLPFANFGDSSKVKVGDIAIAVGSSSEQGTTGTASAGIISSIKKTARSGNVKYQLLQTDAVINQMNIGGVLCNDSGEVIGINCTKTNIEPFNETLNEGIGYAISINEIKKVAKSLVGNIGIKGKDPLEQPLVQNRPSADLGVLGGDASPAEESGIRGAYIQDVIPGSSAADAGLRRSDIIIELDNEVIKKYKDILRVVSEHKIGDRINCKFYRNGKVISKELILY